ncbi:M56 family metallopeptidase [Sphaerisporangium perillae]|uniref:M56 family metallopeptidase n=1 Tax=Sphaerisporangium perillae TaxID=2935860 RepID=UPI00201080EC|nr:M56 family metallopeptidase [Sphaerisporangium perillae]
MRIIVYTPFLVSMLLGLAIPHFGRRLPPATATRLLVGVGAAVAASSAFALACLAWTYLGQLPFIAALGDWSIRLLKAHDPVSPVTAMIALLALGIVSVAAAATVARRCLDYLRAARALRRMRGGPGGLVIVDDPAPGAYAVPGLPGGRGRVVVSTGILRVLSADERRVLLAHERAHLRDRHHLYRAIATVAAALNPLLAALPRTVEYTTERWADERAAGEVGDRRLAARAIATAALATTHHPHQARSAVLGFHHGDVPSRVTCLLAAPPRRHPLVTALVIMALATCLAAVNEVRTDTETLFEQAASRPATPATVAFAHATQAQTAKAAETVHRAG